MNSVARLRRRLLRGLLLATTSTAALLGFAPTGADADVLGIPIDHVDFNLASQWSGESGGATIWANPFGANRTIGVRNGGIDEYAGLTVQSGDWIVSLNANYGRTNTAHDSFAESRFNPPSNTVHENGVAAAHESHVMVDFLVGQDVGLGMFGLEGTSVVSAGVRYAHFVEQTIEHIHYYSQYGNQNNTYKFDHGFAGFGPVISWTASTPACPDVGLSLNWGVTAAMMIGDRATLGGGDTTSKRLLVPQVGGTLGLDWKVPDAPVDLEAGYRVQATFGPFSAARYDAGNPSVDRLSYGPFAGATVRLE